MYSIAISGKANSGKNTVYKLLVEELGISANYVRDIAFADPIKEGLLKLYPSAKRECLFGPSKLRAELIPGLNVTYRQVLCDLGAQARRYDKDHWIKILTDEYEKEAEFVSRGARTKAFIVTDLRFPNEHAALRKLSFNAIIRVKREEQLNLADVSETSQDKLPDSVFDFVIDNNSTLDALKEKCKTIVTRLKERK